MGKRAKRKNPAEREGEGNEEVTEDGPDEAAALHMLDVDEVGS